MAYAWREGRSFPVPAATVGETVATIIAKRGLCRAADLLDAAKSPKSALHPLFEWDDQQAARRYRLQTARTVLTSIEIVRSGQAGPREVAFISLSLAREPLSATPTGGYVHAGEAKLDPKMRRKIVQRELAEIRGQLLRTAWVSEFAPLRSALAELEEGLDPAVNTSMVAD